MKSSDKAFANWILPRLSFIKRIVGGYIRDEHRAEDVVQEVLIKAWKNSGRLYFGEPQLTRWLHVTARNTVLDALRTMRRKHVDHMHSLDINGTYISSSGDRQVAIAVCEESHIMDVYITAAIEAFLEKLPEAQRNVLAMTMNGHTYKEIATHTGTNIGTVRSRLHYARKRAQEELACHH
ncbi:MAG: sigma-70 family RNA polymerase sigma factor [Candidatus Obscuribacterales bacterium]|nr:sigma-70 family RNA polymerase sigma factor [Candidatus Obscuribacterales bacterium]